MNKELLLEIGTEEIPAAFLPVALRDMAEMMEKELSDRRLKHGTIKTLATPRRLTILVEELADQQEDQIVEKIGPSTKAAWDSEGKPTKAALGFAKSQGIELSQLETICTDKGEYLSVRKHIPGGNTLTILPEILSRLITSLPFRKSMRWGSSELRFARPIHWLLALYGGELVPFMVDRIASGASSRGHRFLSPAPFEVKNFSDYLAKTKDNFVLVDPEERRQIILAETIKAAQEINGQPLLDPELVDTIVFLTEYPAVIRGGFEDDYLSLPREVLATTMISKQKYFPVTDDTGRLLPFFLTVSNIKARDPRVVRQGNEKVIRARLADARFFFQEDQKVPLGNRLHDLSQVVFHAQLGTTYDKVLRLQKLAVYLAERLDSERKEICSRAALLAKADLLTQMVGEFPELQGIMGREYALLAGEDPQVAQAIYEHYLPISSGGELPSTDAGAIISIADKIDSIVGFFGVKLPPTGTADPYALRRQALGIINIILKRNYSLKLTALIDQAITHLSSQLKVSPEEVKKDVLDFFKGRLVNQFMAQGYSHDIVDAVVSVGITDVLSVSRKIQALEGFKEREDYEGLAVAFKRVENIIKGFVGNGPAKPEIFIAQEEKLLYRVTGEIREAVISKRAEEDYLGCLVELARLRKPVDDFFAAVMVMADDEKIRLNRLSLLSEISRLIHSLADFSKIQTTG